jgi:hypothetical protein
MAPDDDCPSCGHAHAPGSTCHQCGHYRRCSESVERANGNGACGTTMDATGKEPIVEVIDKFLCIGAFEHTSNIDVLIKCGIRTVMNVRARVRGDTRARVGAEKGVLWVSIGRGGFLFPRPRLVRAFFVARRGCLSRRHRTDEV